MTQPMPPSALADRHFCTVLIEPAMIQQYYLITDGHFNSQRRVRIVPVMERWSFSYSYLFWIGMHLLKTLVSQIRCHFDHLLLVRPKEIWSDKVRENEMSIISAKSKAFIEGCANLSRRKETVLLTDPSKKLSLFPQINKLQSLCSPQLRRLRSLPNQS